MSQKHDYMHWGGRVFAHALTQLFLIDGKKLFNVCNAFVFTLLSAALALHSSGKIKGLSPLVFLASAASLFLFSPAFGSTFLWLDGSCNYLWMPTYVFLYLLPYRFQFDRSEPVIRNPLFCAAYLCAGIIAGWSLENLAVTTVALSILASLLYYAKRRRIYLWNMCGLAGCLIGACFLLFAPGNAARMKVGQFTVHVLDNFVNITAFFFKANTLLWPAVALLAFWVCTGKESRARIGGVAFFYLAGMLISMYSMTLSPVFPAHARVTPIMFCIVAAGCLYQQFEFPDLWRRELLAIFTFAFLCTLGTAYRFAYKDIAAYDKRVRARIEYMLAEKSKGRPDVTVPHVHACTRWCAGWALEDINENPKHWTSAPVARYYGLRSVRARKEPF
ncbi:MAG: hypothetical protein J6Z30_03070 [Pyramidobacter sp.]|nr:hypothetical protein [Pyramidobacter sp.]